MLIRVTIQGYHTTRFRCRSKIHRVRFPIFLTHCFRGRTTNIRGRQSVWAGCIPNEALSPVHHGTNMAPGNMASGRLASDRNIPAGSRIAATFDYIYLIYVSLFRNKCSIQTEYKQKKPQNYVAKHKLK